MYTVNMFTRSKSCTSSENPPKVGNSSETKVVHVKSCSAWISAICGDVKHKGSLHFLQFLKVVALGSVNQESAGTGAQVLQGKQNACLDL